MHKIHVFGIKPYQSQLLTSKTRERPFELEINDRPLTSINATEAEAVVFTNSSRANRRIIESMPSLKFLQTISIGTEHIDLEAARDRNIIVCNSPAFCQESVAEHAFGLLLNISRQISASIESARRGTFIHEEHVGFDLMGKTAGIIGTGGIGSRIGALSKAFGMNLLGCSRAQNPQLVSLGMKYTSLERVLDSSDILFLCCALNDDTEKIINRSNIERIKKGAVLINIARIKLIEEVALFDGLERGILSFAGLDTSPSEQLINHPKILLTPHNAFNSDESLSRLVDITITNLETYFAGRMDFIGKLC